MKYQLAVWIVFSLLVSACTDKSQGIEDNTEAEPAAQAEKRTVETPRFPSPSASVQQTIGRSTVMIKYSRPSVISSNGVDRTGNIWGKLVPYDFNFRPSMGGGKPRPWRAGANENTTITFSDDAKVEGKSILAGTYGLHMAIHENGGATVIFSNTSDAWGSFSYEESEDALRVEADTEQIPLRQRLIYTINMVDGTSSTVALDWEKKRIAFQIEFDTHGMVIDDFRELLQDTTGITWRDYNRAAAYCASNNVSLEEGMEWIEKSISMDINYTNLSTKSTIFDVSGKKEDALQVKNEALQLPSTSASNFYSYGTLLIRQGRADQAMEIYQRLSQRWPDHWLTAHGLARGYSAQGKYESALEYEKDALSKAPDANKGFIEGAIELLENGIDFN